MRLVLRSSMSRLPSAGATQTTSTLSRRQRDNTVCRGAHPYPATTRAPARPSHAARGPLGGRTPDLRADNKGAIRASGCGRRLADGPKRRLRDAPAQPPPPGLVDAIARPRDRVLVRLSACSAVSSAVRRSRPGAASPTCASPSRLWRGGGAARQMPTSGQVQTGTCGGSRAWLSSVRRTCDSVPGSLADSVSRGGRYPMPPTGAHFATCGNRRPNAVTDQRREPSREGGSV